MGRCVLSSLVASISLPSERDPSPLPPPAGAYCTLLPVHCTRTVFTAELIRLVPIRASSPVRLGCMSRTVTSTKKGDFGGMYASHTLVDISKT
jgi:hypothetical protein